MARDDFGSSYGYQRRAARKGGKYAVLAVIAIAAIVLLIGGCTAGMKSVGEGRATITVTEKITKRDGDSDKYLIYVKPVAGQDKVYQNTDSIMYLKFDSSDMYAELEVGKTYDCKTWGWRVPFFSSYKNLINCTEVDDES